MSLRNKFNYSVGDVSNCGSHQAGTFKYLHVNPPKENSPLTIQHSIWMPTRHCVALLMKVYPACLLAMREFNFFHRGREKLLIFNHKQNDEWDATPHCWNHHRHDQQLLRLNLILVCFRGKKPQLEGLFCFAGILAVPSEGMMSRTRLMWVLLFSLRQKIKIPDWYEAKESKLGNMVKTFWWLGSSWLRTCCGLPRYGAMLLWDDTANQCNGSSIRGG